MPKVSVILPVFNSEKYVFEAIQSILNQSFKDFEFIIINDGSTDNSLEIIKLAAESDNRIIFINNEKNLGLIKTLNIGLNLATGEYIIRMDGDDVSKYDRIENYSENDSEKSAEHYNEINGFGNSKWDNADLNDYYKTLS